MELQSVPANDAAKLFAEAVAIMARLRAPGGCPWDREQTFASIQPYTLEEAYEVFDAIDRQHWPDLCEELGDLLLQVLFYAQMATDAGHFGIADVVASLNAKLIRRHPHVFPPQPPREGAQPDGAHEQAGIDSAQVVRNWEAIKQQEKAHQARSAAKPAGEPASALDGVLRSLPGLLEALKLGSRARKSGFDWPDAEGLFDKLREETAELREAIASQRSGSAGMPDGDAAGAGSSSEAVASEIGDLLFTAVNLARHLDVDPERALRHSNAKFRRRFAMMESAATHPLESLSPAELEALWEKAKAAELPAPPIAP